MSDDACRWYVMLFPADAVSARITRLARQLAEHTGGTPNPTPHVTAGYFTGVAALDVVMACVRPLTGPAICIRASGLFSWSEQPHPLFGYTLSLRVRRDGSMEAWQCAVRHALCPTGLTPIFTWEQQQPHMQMVRGIPVPPRDALALLPDRDYSLAWTATRLVVSRETGSDFVRVLEQGLHDQPLLLTSPPP
jgi:hypothetical protein